MKTILCFLFIFISCDSNKNNNARWLLDINLQDQKLQTIVKINDDKGILYNSDEEITLTKNNDGYQIGANYSHLKFSNDFKSGYWIRDNKENYQVPFSAKKTKKTDLFSVYENKNCENTFGGDWKIKLSEDKTGLGTFNQIGCRIKGSILTTTGDYRYLDGYLQNNKVHLQGFDGVFSFILKLTLTRDTFVGEMYAGKSYKAQIKGKKDENFKLADANELTRILDHKETKLALIDIDNKLIDISKGEYANKPKIIQLFGSWCPNCLDETRFINKWRNENLDLQDKIKFIALGFENFKTKKEALKALKKSKDKLNMQYPLILADFNKSVKAQDLLPIDKVRAYPTTLFLNSKNKVLKVHTGFAGQATGLFFEQFTKEFDETIRKLISTDKI
jgi:thiol-disulfide isomerase/thioredoxin